jgi:hypothetical protein
MIITVTGAGQWAAAVSKTKSNAIRKQQFRRSTAMTIGMLHCKDTVFDLQPRHYGPVSTCVHIIEGVLKFLHMVTGCGARQGEEDEVHREKA